jgi:hypothetical protein
MSTDAADTSGAWVDGPLRHDDPERWVRETQIQVTDLGHAIEIVGLLRDVDRMGKPPLPSGVYPRRPCPPAEREERDRLNREKASRRAAKTVRQACAFVGADRLLTVTYRGAMTDLERLVRDWHELVRRIKRVKGGRWDYVAVPERHKSGGWHLHVALRGRQDYRLLRSVWWSIVGEGQGNIDVRNPGRGERLQTHKLAAYIAKYIGKAFEENELSERKRYYKARSIKVPGKECKYVDCYDWPDVLGECYRIARERGAGMPKFWFCEALGIFWLSASCPKITGSGPGG